MATTIVALILAFVSGVLIGIVVGDKKLTKAVEAEAEKALDLNKDGKLDIKDAQTALDLNKDGKVDTKDLDIAKTELKKTATQVTKLVKKVK